MNKCMFVGNVVSDVEVKATNSGKSVANLRIAVNRRGKDAGADFFDFVVWDKTAEFAEKYCTKGQRVGIESHAQTRSYEKDGKKYTVVEFMVDNLELLGSKQ